MATASQIDILIDIRSRLDQVEQATRGIASLKKEASGLSDAFTLGLGAGFSAQLVSGLSQIAGAMQNTIRAGVEFNATLESAQLGIAAVLKQFDRTGRFKTFDDAMRESSNAIDLLKQKAVESPASFESLVQAFQATAGAATSAGIPLKKQIDLIVNLSQAISGLGIRNEQIVQETRALLTGNITEDAAAARILGITGAQVQQAKETGQLFEFLSGKITSFAEAGKRGAETYNTALSNFGDIVQQVQGEVSKPIFEALKNSFLDLTKVIQSPEIKSGLKQIGTEIASFVQLGSQAIKFALEYSGAIISLGKSLVTLVAAYTALKTIQGAFSLAQTIVQWISLKTATDGVAKATTQDTLATQANTVSKNQNTLAVIANIRERLKEQEIGLLTKATQSVSGGVQAAAGAATSFGSKLAGALGTLNGMLVVAGLITTATNLWVDNLNASTEKLNSLNDGFNEQIRSVNDQLKGLESLEQKEKLRNDLIASRKVLESDSLNRKGDEAVAYQNQIQWIDLMVQKLGLVSDAQIKINASSAQALRDREKQAQLDAQDAGQLEEVAKKARLTQKQISFNALPSDSSRIDSLKSDRQAIFNKASKDSQTSIGSTSELATQFSSEDAKAKAGGSDAVKARAKRRAEDLQEAFEIEKQISELEQKQIKDADTLQKKDRERRDLISDIAALEKEISGDKAGANTLRLDSQRQKSFDQFKDKGLSDPEAAQGADLERQKQADIFANQQREDQRKIERQNIQSQIDTSEAKAVSLRIQGQLEKAQSEENFQEVLKETLNIMEREKISVDEARTKAQQLAGDRQKLVEISRQQVLAETQAQNKISQIQSQRSVIDARRFVSPGERNKLVIDSIIKEQQALIDLIKLWEKRRSQIQGDSPDAILARDQLSTNINDAQYKTTNLETQKQSLTGEGQFTGEIDQALARTGTLAQESGRIVSESMTTAFSGVSASISGAIVRGEDWRETMRNTSLSIIDGLIQMGVQMLLMKTLGATLQAASQTQAITTGATQAAAYAPAAAAASVSSFGGAAIAGTIAATLAIATIIGLLSGGFNEGGMIPGSPSSTDNRIAMVATGEYVARSSAVQYYGAGTFEALNQMRVPKGFLSNMNVPVSARPSYGYATGGLVAPLEAAQSEQKSQRQQNVQVAFVNSRQDMKSFLAQDGQKSVTDIARMRSVELGI